MPIDKPETEDSKPGEPVRVDVNVEAGPAVVTAIGHVADVIALSASGKIEEAREKVSQAVQLVQRQLEFVRTLSTEQTAQLAQILADERERSWQLNSPLIVPSRSLAEAIDDTTTVVDAVNDQTTTPEQSVPTYKVLYRKLKDIAVELVWWIDKVKMAAGDLADTSESLTRLVVAIKTLADAIGAMFSGFG